MTSVTLLHAVLPFLTALPECPRGRLTECAEVVSAAVAHGVSPRLLVAVATAESGFDRRVVSRRGAVGLLQVVPGYWCHGPGRCDYTDAGARAVRLLTDRHGVERGLCHYNAGNTCNPRSLRWARHVVRTAR